MSATPRGNGQVSAAVRINGELLTIPTDSAHSVFPIYSITKTLTAICALRLVETGSLRLAEAARKFLADDAIPATITLTHLLRHPSGLRDYGPLPEYHEAVRTHPDRPWTRQQFLEAVLSRSLLFAPGTGFSYSNVGYMCCTGRAPMPRPRRADQGTVQDRIGMADLDPPNVWREDSGCSRRRSWSRFAGHIDDPRLFIAACRIRDPDGHAGTQQHFQIGRRFLLSGDHARD